jgi:hypothetical protein
MMEKVKNIYITREHIATNQQEQGHTHVHGFPTTIASPVIKLILELEDGSKIAGHLLETLHS